MKVVGLNWFVDQPTHGPTIASEGKNNASKDVNWLRVETCPLMET